MTASDLLRSIAMTLWFPTLTNSTIMSLVEIFMGSFLTLILIVVPPYVYSCTGINSAARIAKGSKNTNEKLTFFSEQSCASLQDATLAKSIEGESALSCS
jgi:hypothetical protein